MRVFLHERGFLVQIARIEIDRCEWHAYESSLCSLV